MGYGRKKQPNGEVRVYNKINGNLFDPKYAEHWMCKLYLHVKYVGPNYRRTAKAKAAAPHCHPHRYRQVDCDEISCENVWLKEHMMHTTCAFPILASLGTMRERQLCSAPSPIVLPNEKLPAVTLESLRDLQLGKVKDTKLMNIC